MSKLYIIGNGFDLAHELDTSYWDFRDFLEEHDSDFLLEFEKLYSIYYLDNTEYGYSAEAQTKWNDRIYNTLWCEFEKNMGFPDTQDMLELSNSVLDNMDLETGNIGIIDTMDEYWRKQYGLINKLQKYVKEWISQIDLSEIKPRKKTLIENIDDYFFNFNYTRLLEDVYQIEKIVHIHGSIGKDAESSPFMGHCNQKEIDKHWQCAEEATKAGNEGETSIHNAIAEYLTAIYKDTSHYIWENNYFFNKLKSVDEVIIIGWSAGEVDLPYLRKIRDSVNKKTKWLAYYYDDTAYNSLKNAFLQASITNCFQTEFIQSNNFWD